MLRHAVGIAALLAVGASAGARAQPAPAVATEPVAIRLALLPGIATGGTLPVAALRRLQTLTAQPLVLSRVTPTGGLEFALPRSASMADAEASVKALRVDRAVLWAEALYPKPPMAKSATDVPSVNKLMLRARDDVADVQPLLPRLSALAGVRLTVERRIGEVWVLRLGANVSEAALADIASRLQDDASVQYADAVRRVYAKRVPDNALYEMQWSLNDRTGGVNAASAWDLQTGNANITVAVVDTGVLPHPALAGRLLPGYDFISDNGRAGDGNGRDNDPTDPGDYVRSGECGSGAPVEDSSWHGTFVSGIIGANANTGLGIAGLDWKARILPVRVLGKCGGSFDDILDGMLWAAGVPVDGVPLNPNPARVINMSLGGAGGCPHSIQAAIDTVMAQGAIIVVAAGNESDDATQSSPASCSGVITVGASTRQGDRTSYSNFGRRVDVSAPGGAGETADWILSTSNNGATTATTSDYLYGIGTSFAAPHVTGTVSLMLARNAGLTPGRVLDIVTATSRPFATATVCAGGTQCGTGLLDTGLAVQSTIPSVDIAPAGSVAVVEYYRADKDHYFMTVNPAEIAALDAAHGAFQRTGLVFYAWTSPGVAPANARPVCRFYALDPLIDSHFYTASASECQYVATRYPGVWTLESPAAFYVVTSDAAGICPVDTLPVYRFFDNRRDANHRHTVDLTVKRAMLNRAWTPEGIGANSVAFCSPVG